MLIVIEGVDGAGKRTLTTGLRAAFEAAHKSLASLAFPRYGHSIEADLAAEALHGGHGDLSSSVYAMALLFASTVPPPATRSGTSPPPTLVNLDRYVASNAAYSAARLHQGADGDVAEWVRTLEYDRLHLPKPDWQVLLDVPKKRSAPNIAPTRKPTAPRMPTERDDSALQRFTGEVYSGLASAQWCGRWLEAERRRARRRPGSIADSRAREQRFIAIW